MQVEPAYGRDYKSAKAAQADWLAGKDFVIVDLFNPDYGRFIARPQAPAGTHIILRFDQQRKTANAK